MKRLWIYLAIGALFVQYQAERLHAWIKYNKLHHNPEEFGEETPKE
jgi:hypothetical protein